MKKRTKARELALEALYRFEITSNTPDTILDDICARTHLTKEITCFMQALVYTTIKELIAIDEIISCVVENWKMDRLAIIDKNILRLATCEIMYFKDTPKKVSINEAIELAKKYSTAESSKFVNGILDKIINEKKVES
ncbi:MAG: transcription antitermination factor NusB [Candidatus Stahlbacteria bacterium]|nr:transcription antitermination factor NusB [Candidatus Stahlbacteria bacterium]